MFKIEKGYVYHSEYDYVVKTIEEGKSYGNAKAEYLCLNLGVPVQFDYSTKEDDHYIVKFYLFEKETKA